MYLLIAVLLIDMDSVRATEQLNPIRFGIMGQSPYGFFSEAGIPKGYLYDIANAVLEEAGFLQDTVILPHKRLMSALIAKERNCSLFASTPLISEQNILVEPIGKSVRLGVLPRAGIHLNDYEDLKSISIAVARGVAFHPRFDNDNTLNKVKTKNYYQDALMLKRGRVEAVAGAIGSHLHNLKKIGWGADNVGTPLILTELPIWLVCIKNDLSKDLIGRLRIAVQSLRERGAITDIVEDYLGKAHGELQ
ncbi:ABC transporter substrate-binding protein [Motiliproteus sp. MSK22-1]|uniref:substrate-binding periplasmic protein n=1 Tax=Motiliproteus sp. MSK22-1 TaxID=1897630 RepID=UPI0009780150|nr:ABC transporter substrate-binding protein [Motiliproteus sp. MSK22-1]OMH26590.1 hypothetical protein BGP75_23110 [Motiliproteus sp. MSK22-1]